MRYLRILLLVKLLSFTALCLHWFNPLVWLAAAKGSAADPGAVYSCFG